MLRHALHPSAPARCRPLRRTGPSPLACLAALVALASGQPLLGQGGPGPDEAVRAPVAAMRAHQPPVVDGRDDDPVWQSIPAVSDFRQYEPTDGAPPTYRTSFRVAFDERNLYVFVRAHDPSPDSILRALSRRDVRGPSDQVRVIVDSHHDRRSGFEFAVNPDGVKRDFALFNDGDRDSAWDGVWEVATAVDDAGWTAEFRIPLSQLPYPDADAHTFGLGIFRDIERHQEVVTWPAIRRTRPGLASQLGVLEGLEGLGTSRALEVIPYVVTRNESRALEPRGWERAHGLSAGADVRARLTPYLTLNATLNPDFGQVEADPAVLSLDAFEVFQGERRPFFVEGGGRYRFRLNCYIVVDCQTNEDLFYSRRIGRPPSLRGTYGDASTPTATPIAGAVKLTGRTGSGFSFGILDAVTREVGGTQGRTAEPRTNHAVISAEQDLRGGAAGLQLLATAVNRSLDEWTTPYLHESAYSGAAGARTRFGGGNYEASGSLAVSRVAGSPEAIDRTQRNAVHYYQRPDGGPAYDPTRTSLSGHAGQLKVGKYGGGLTRFESSYVWQSSGFDVNDLGYLRRADLRDWSTWGSLNFLEPTRAYRSLRLNGNVWRTWNGSGDVLVTAVNTNAHLSLHGGWGLGGGGTLNRFGEAYCDRCTRGGPLLRTSRGLYPWFYLDGDNRRALVPGVNVNLGFTDEGQTHSYSVFPSLRVRPSTRFEGRVGLRYRKNEDATQWLGNYTDPSGDTHYAFAHLDQETVSANLRLNYTAGRDLTFEFYAEPFLSRGRYSDVRELSGNPRAPVWADRFQPYEPPSTAPSGFRSRQLRSNMVVRWEYRPGSTLFLAWAHGRDAWNDAHGDQGLGTEWNDLFDLHPQNTFLVKVAHWLSW